ncbi:MAG: CoA transferase [Thalassobaculales bacterium]
MTGALSGLRVLDFGHFIAGPLCAQLLAGLGAEVIRVERPGGGGDRHLQPLAAGLPGGAVYLQLNRGKRSLALDPFSPAARPVLDRLLATADVVVANMPPATLAAIGIDWQRLHGLNPRAVLASCTAFGPGAPERPGFDGIGQAMSGAMHLSGEDGVPRKSAIHYVDYLTGALSAFAVMGALAERRSTGSGRHVEASLLGTALFTAAAGLAEEALLAPGRVGTGNRGQLAGPADTFRTRDGFVLVQVLGDGMFGRCARLIGRPEWLADPRLRDDLARGRHGAELSAAMQDWCAPRTSAEVLGACAAAGLPAAPVLDYRAALGDPLVRAILAFDDTGMPTVPLPGLDAARLGAAPALGADTAAILGALGLDAASLAALSAAGAIGGPA